MKRNIEVLAPAGSFESLQASFKAGADAVYMGGSSFGARAYADNPDDDELLRAIHYSHLRGKKLYLTVNTLVKEREFARLYKFLEKPYLNGLDAVIVQDFGVLNFIEKYFPSLPIHMSTQAGVTEGGISDFLGKNVTRIVPARELGIDEIRNLKKRTRKEIEVFVHGALCYSYSGQCLFSSMCGDRSGNRGRCAQPCRQLYRLNEGKSNYLLSPKDICTLENIPYLLEAGVDSLKIEGRMKSPEYACYTSKTYSDAVEYWLENGSDKYFEKYKKDNAYKNGIMISLMDLFNRGGFSKGYAFDDTGRKMMSVERPNHNGVKMGGCVIKDGFAVFKTEIPLYKGDVLEVRGLKANDIYTYTLPNDIKSGKELRFRAVKSFDVKKTEGKRAEVYRIRREELLRNLRERYIDEAHRCEVDGELLLEPGKRALLTVCRCVDGERNVTVECYGAEVSEAIKAPLIENDVYEKLSRTGDSQFVFEKLSVKIAGDCFLPKSALGAIRREAFERLEEKIIREYSRADDIIVPAEHGENKRNKYEAVLEVCCFNTEQLAEAEKSAADVLILDLDGFGESVMEALELVRKSDKKICIRTNHIADGKSAALLRRVVTESDRMPDGVYIRSLSFLTYLKNYTGRIYADKSLYTFNSEAAEFYAGKGMDGFVLPAELSEKEMKEIIKPADMSMKLWIYGQEEVMVSKQCVRKSSEKCTACRGFEQLADMSGAVYNVFCSCEQCRNFIYKAEPIDLRNRINKAECFADSVIIGFVNENKSEVKAVIEDFVCGRTEMGKSSGKENIGHFSAGVL